MALTVLRRELGKLGREWVRRSLREGHELSAAALSALDLSAGHVYGFYPPMPDEADVTRFEGTLFSKRGAFPPELAAEAEDAVIEFAREIGGHSWLLETGITNVDFNNDSRKTSGHAPPAERLLSLPHVAFWHPLHAGTTEDVSRFLSSQGGYDNAFVVEGEETMSAVGSMPPDRASARLASAISAVLVPAYDAETYVLWTGPRHA